MSLVSDDSRNCRSCLSTPPHFFGFKDHLLVLSYCSAIQFSPLQSAFYYLPSFLGSVIRFLTLAITFRRTVFMSLKEVLSSVE